MPCQRGRRCLWWWPIPTMSLSVSAPCLTLSPATELFIASLASCVAFYARRYLARHNLATEGLAVEAIFDMGSKPARVAGIDMRLIVPEGVPAGRLDALLAVATHCTVHNTLVSEPEVLITLADAPSG